MKYKKIIGIILCITGVLSLFGSAYINNEVKMGEKKIESAEGKVNAGRALFGLTPYTKEAGQKLFFDPADREINDGKQKIDYYQNIAKYLRAGGIGSILVGILLILLPTKKNR